MLYHDRGVIDCRGKYSCRANRTDPPANACVQCNQDVKKVPAGLVATTRASLTLALWVCSSSNVPTPAVTLPREFRWTARRLRGCRTKSLKHAARIAGPSTAGARETRNMSRRFRPPTGLKTNNKSRVRVTRDWANCVACFCFLHPVGRRASGNRSGLGAKHVKGKRT